MISNTMDTKLCARCKFVKQITDFHKNKNMKDGYQSACISCMNKSYNKTRNKYIVRYNQVRRERQENICKQYRKWKEFQKCVVCEESNPICLDLHHIDPTQKEIEVSNAARNGWSWKRILSEIEKCIVLCSNCHRKVHAGQILLNEYNYNIRAVA